MSMPRLSIAAVGQSARADPDAATPEGGVLTESAAILAAPASTSGLLPTAERRARRRPPGASNLAAVVAAGGRAAPLRDGRLPLATRRWRLCRTAGLARASSPRRRARLRCPGGGDTGRPRVLLLSPGPMSSRCAPRSHSAVPALPAAAGRDAPRRSPFRFVDDEDEAARLDEESEDDVLAVTPRARPARAARGRTHPRAAAGAAARGNVRSRCRPADNRLRTRAERLCRAGGAKRKPPAS